MIKDHQWNTIRQDKFLVVTQKFEAQFAIKKKFLRKQADLVPRYYYRMMMIGTLVTDVVTSTLWWRWQCLLFTQRMRVLWPRSQYAYNLLIRFTYIVNLTARWGRCNIRDKVLTRSTLAGHVRVCILHDVSSRTTHRLEPLDHVPHSWGHLQMVLHLFFSSSHCSHVFRFRCCAHVFFSDFFFFQFSILWKKSRTWNQVPLSH